MPRLKKPRQPLKPEQEALRLVQHFNELCRDFGGEAMLSALQRQLLRRAAFLMLRGEVADLDVLAGRPVDMQRYVSECAMLLRILSRLGARAAHVIPEREETLQDYLAKRDLSRIDSAAGEADDNLARGRPTIAEVLERRHAATG